MKIFILTLSLLIIITIITSIRVFRGKKSMSSSCGGLNNAYLNNDGQCQVCGKEFDKEVRENLLKK